MNNLLLRRRALMGISSKGNDELIEYPDWIRVDFDTDTDNKTMNLSYINCAITDCMLDGTVITVTSSISSGLYSITIPNSGEHTLYLKIQTRSSSASGFGYFAQNIKRIRFPYNICDYTFDIAGGRETWDTVEVLDTRCLESLKTRTKTINNILVPIGSKAQYESVVSAERYATIEEVDFKYKIV